MTIDQLIDIAIELSESKVLIKEGLEVRYNLLPSNLERLDKELYIKNNGSIEGWEKNEVIKLPIYGINFVLCNE